MNKKIIIIISLILALACIVIVFLNIGFPSLREPEKKEFSREAWDKYPYERGPMLDDLLQKYNFINMSKDEVISILGTNELSIGEVSMRYETGGGFLHDEILSFTLDSNEKVINVGIAN